MSDNDNKPFIWAQDVHANVKEPIQQLREQGWRYGDVPAASNFNWIFKTMTEEIVALRSEFRAQKEFFTRQLAKHTENQEQLHNKISKVRDKVSILDESLRDDVRLLSQSIEITWRTLRETGEIVKRYHPNFPSPPWPSCVFPERECND